MKETWGKMKGKGKRILKACMGPIELYRKRGEAWRHLKPYKKEIIATITASILVMLIDAFAPYVIGRLIDKGSSLSNELLLAIVVVLYLGYTLKDYLDKYVTENKDKVSLYSEIDLRWKAHYHFSKLPFEYHQKNDIGGVEERINRAANYLCYLVGDVLFLVLPQIILSLVVFFLLLSINYLFSLIVAVTIAIYTILTLLIAEARIESEKEIKCGFNNLASSVHDAAVNLSSVKSLRIEDPLGQKHYKQGIGIKQSIERLFKKVASKDFLQRNILTAGIVVSYFLMLLFLKEGKISFGEVIMVASYIAMLKGPFSSLSRQYSIIKKVIVNLESVNKILDEPEEPYEVGEDVKNPNGAIKIENLSYTPDDGNETLNDVNIEIPDGPGLYAIVGESGSGKTTLWKILLRYLRYCAGKVSFGGILVEDLKISSLRKNILSIERTLLFNRSIRYNVKVGNQDASDDMVKEALRAVRLDYLIDCLDRVVGLEKTSNGEKQRIVFARAFVNQTASVFFFDEPTQALDPVNAANIMKLLKELSLTKKVIVITHDLSNMIGADRTYVMEKGRKVEEGTHEELMNKKGKYAEHFFQQSEIIKLLRDHAHI